MISELSKKEKSVIFFGLIVGMLLSALTSTVVSTAMPRIIASLGGMEYLSWALMAYMLSSTIAMPIAGKLSDLYGRKPFYIGGIIIFLVGSFLCGISANIGQFIFFRALAGIGGGIMQSNAMTLVADLYPPSERGKYQGYIGGVFGLASLIGPVLGGYITDHYTWNWVFWINIPLGLLAIAILGAKLPHLKKTGTGKIDYYGSALLISAFTPMLIAFTLAGSNNSWSSPSVVILLLVAAVSLVLFFLVEKRVEEPILPMTLFQNPVFSIIIITTFLMSSAMFGTLMYIPMFVQGVLAYSASGSGIALAPMMGGLVLASIITGRIVSRTGKYRILVNVAFVIMSVSMFLLSRMDENTSMGELIRNMVLFGWGMGMALPIFLVAVQSAFPHSMVGTVTSGSQFFRSIGGTFGVAIFGTILNSSFQEALASGKPTADGQIPMLQTPQKLFNSNIINDVELSVSKAHLITELRSSLAESFQQVFFIASLVLAVSLIFSFFLKEIPLRKTNRPASEQAGMELMADGVAVEGLVAPPRGEPDIYNTNTPPSSRMSRGVERSATQASP